MIYIPVANFGTHPLVSKTFPGFPALGVQNCLKLGIL